MKTMQYYANSGEFQGELINNDKYYKSEKEYCRTTIPPGN